jgi:hypothetical protein
VVSWSSGFCSAGTSLFRRVSWIFVEGLVASLSGLSVKWRCDRVTVPKLIVKTGVFMPEMYFWWRCECFYQLVEQFRRLVVRRSFPSLLVSAKDQKFVDRTALARDVNGLR